MEKQHILVIGTVWPEPCSSAAGIRMMQLIESFQSRGWKVTFASAAADSDFMIDLQSKNIDKVSILLNDKSFDQFIRRLNPSIVLFDRFMTEEQFGWRIAENCPDVLRILDTEDLHCLRTGRQKAFKEKREFRSDDLNSDVAKREIASIYRCDLSLIISGFEMKLLSEHFKVDESLLHYVPFMLDPAQISDGHSFSERKNFVTIGNFLHEPNWNVVQYLKEDIWPLIRKKLPDADLHVYGAYPSQKVNALNNPKEGFHIIGRVDDAQAVIKNARILLSPLRFGAGLKGKFIDSMLYGTPSVTTSVGAEAMHDNLEWNGIIADCSNDIADAAVKLYTDELLWKRSQENGFKIINTLFRKSELSEILLQRIVHIQKDLQKHRGRNFIGAMLMHHTISGTKYMGRWIEEKNKSILPQ